MAQAMTTTEKRAVATGSDGEATRDVPTYLPATDIYETAEDVVVIADLPGVPPENVDVSLERQQLTIRGRLPIKAHEGYRRALAEYGEGDFERSFTLTDAIDRERIEASHRNGVLMLRLPKAERARSRRIQVQAA